MKENNPFINNFCHLLESMDCHIDDVTKKMAKDSFIGLKDPFEVDDMFFEQSRFFLRKYGLNSGEFMIGPNIKNLKSHVSLFKNNISSASLNGLIVHYKQQFVRDRNLRFIGLDLDDCIYDNAPVKKGLLDELNGVITKEVLNTSVEDLYHICKDTGKDDVSKKLGITKLLLSGKMVNGQNVDNLAENILKQYRDFMLLKNHRATKLFKTYDNVTECLKSFMDNRRCVIAIITNGESVAQREKLKILGLQKGVHFDFVLISDDLKISKPSKAIYGDALKMASTSSKLNPTKINKKRLMSEHSMILEDRVENISGADKWLKVQLLRGRHSDKLPQQPSEIPKYGILDFKTLSIIPEVECDKEYQDMFALFFLFKSLLLMHYLKVEA